MPRSVDDSRPSEGAQCFVRDMNTDLHLVLSGKASEARMLRGALRRWLAEVQINGAIGRDIVGAVSEAFANAVEHPLERRADAVLIDGEIESSEVVVRVRDHGQWQHEVDPARRHYGFRLMEGLMDAVAIERSDRGTVVTLRRAIPR